MKDQKDVIELINLTQIKQNNVNDEIFRRLKKIENEQVAQVIIILAAIALSNPSFVQACLTFLSACVHALGG